MRSPLHRSALAAGALICSVASALAASPIEPPTNGPKRVDARWHAITGATVITRPGRAVEDATIVIRDGVILSVEAGADPPPGARVHNAEGLRVYAGFIEPYAEVAAPEPDENAPGRHWRRNVTPERSALDGDGLGKSGREALRKLGFTAAAIAPEDGLFRGSAALVALAGEGDEISASSPRVVREAVYQSAAPERGGWGGTPPTSLMGAIAVMRQTFSDAGWQADALEVASRRSEGVEPVERIDALTALGANNAESTPILFDADTSLNALRMAKVAEEFGRRAILLGSGEEFERASQIADLGVPLVVPVRYPDAPDVTSIAAAESVSLRELMAWEQAPTNLRRLKEAGALIALTTHRLEKRAEFWPNVRKAIEMGLSADDALAMMTVNAASILGAGDSLGTIDAGKLAHLVVFDGDPFTDEDATLREVWSAGKRHLIEEAPADEFDGAWAFAAGDAFSGELTIEKEAKGASLESGGATVKARHVDRAADRISFVIDGDAFGLSGTYRLSGVLDEDAIAGQGAAPSGESFAWSATRQPAADDGDDDEAGDSEGSDEKTADLPPEKLPVPFGAYGLTEQPREESVMVTGATIWTASDRGIIENGALITRGGAIVYVGPASEAPSARVDRTIDASGKHLTPGLFDAHSHMGISSGVNEGGEAVTSEVRIQDVIDSDDIAWYRALAGGLTAANQLHGSANPIGGQNTVVKLRWGAGDPQAFLVDGAPGGIKFALGENVKRRSGRYPDTRMGVEALIRDRFIAAAEYQKQWESWNELNARERLRRLPPRRDLELEALVEILEGDRLIHCHSYRQDEILMLCRIAEDFGFTIGTFQHVLEGYKVAEAIAQHSLGGSSFSDWWAYKFEVFDAIPHNGALMREAGVTVSFNSDSNELARRMNTEAAKAVRYGGVEPSEALRFVTLNAAKQFKVEDRMGSLEAGKDADFVIWSGDPLSTMTRCESTWVDGRELFSLERDRELRQRDRAERERLIQKVLAEGKPTGPAVRDVPEDTRDTDAPDKRPTFTRGELIGLEMLQAGLDPDLPTCGECGFMDRLGLHESHAHEGGER